MLNDCRGCPTSASDKAEVAAFDAALELYCNYELSTGAAVKQLLADHPTSVMGAVLRGYSMLMLESVGVQDKVAATATGLLETADHANNRERLHLAALARWAGGGDVIAAAEMWDRILADHPTDLLALKLHHYTTFWTGRSQVLTATVEGVIDAWDPSTPGYDHVLGMNAFALNECGRFEDAERVGRDAVAINSDDLWSVHAIAHALEMQGSLDAGIEFFDVDPDTWSGKNPFIGHIWWHSALFPWNKGAYDAVLDIYDQRLRPASTEFFLDLQNLSSLLIRLDLSGVDVGDRWDELADYAAERIGDHVLTFTDVHAAMTLARTGRTDELEQFLASLSQHRSSRPPGISTTGIDLALELGRGFWHIAHQEFAAAATTMARVRGDLAPIGGSHAQRDIFDLILISATELAGDAAMALHLLRARTRRWPNSVPTWQRYSRVLGETGHTEAAQLAASTALEISR